MGYQIQTLNAISPAIRTKLDANYTVAPDVQSPDAILVRSASMHEMALPQSVLCIARAGAGVNNIPIEACSKAGICVFNTPGANANAVCELVLAGMLLSCRDIVGGIAWANGLKPQGAAVEAAVEKGKKAFAGPELRGKTLGVVGLGEIGVRVANAADALGMEVIGYDPMISVEHAWKLSRGIRREGSLDALFACCDFVTLHVPLTDKTRGMVSERVLSGCRKGLRLLNFARGGLVDEEAVLAALGDERVSRYVTDFPNANLLGVEGVLCMPHLGASTPESEENCAVMAAAQTRDFLEHGIIHNSVNLPEVQVSAAHRPRLLCIHENVPNMLGSITSCVATFGLNIAELINRSRGEMAVSVVDMDDMPGGVSETLLARVRALPGMRSVRLLGL